MVEEVLLCDSNICRLCAEGNENVIDIYSLDENSPNIQQTINKYLPIVVEQDNKYPRNICPGCHIQLEATKLFMDLIVNGQLLLRELLKKQQAKLAKATQLEEAVTNLQNFPLYSADHEMMLRVQGLDRPRRKRGRPAKKVAQEGKLESIEENLEETREERVEEEEIGPDGRRKRRVRAPVRFDGLVQGKELEDILKKEGVIDDEVGKDATKNTSDSIAYGSEIIIGRTEGEFGEDLGRPIFINRQKFRSKTVNFKKIQLKKFDCHICSKIFINEINFDLHLKSHENSRIDATAAESSAKPTAPEGNAESDKTSSETAEPSAEISKRRSPVIDETKKFPCDVCGKVLLRPSSLIYHKETEHNNRWFICNKCDRSFKHKQLLQRHQIVHSDERPFVCPVCNASFKTQVNLVNHEGVHTGEKKFECTECDQKFAHRTSLSLHQRWHAGKKPYTCEFCQKSFSQNGNLLEHKRIHTGEKPFFCEICGKSFTTSSQLRIHVKRHTGEKPWKCDLCEKSFLHRDTYKFHLNRHLNDRPYVCPTCDRSFTEPWALKKHERIHTGEKPYACEYCAKSFADKSNKEKHMKRHKLTIGTPSNELQLTQLVDQQGNPISVTTQDGQTVPVVRSGDDDSNIQGLLPDGTLVPIQIAAVHDKDYTEEIARDDGLDLLETSTNDAIDLDQTLGNDAMQDLSSNFQLLSDNSVDEVCLVAYSIEEDGALTQELVLESALVQN